MTETFDVLIVGGGSAGAVLVNRLSEDGTRRILLLEAGSAYSPNLYPPDLANADITGGPDGHDWGYVGATGIGGRSIRALRGKALGGSSTVKRAVVEQLDAYHHPTSTVRMGLEGSGVVDGFGRVYGLLGLMVVDASIMPFVPSAPTNLTTIMIAEHIARHCLVPRSAKASSQKGR